MLPLLLTSKVNLWRVLGLGGLVAVALMALYVRGLSLQLKRDEVVYRNPAVRIHVKKIRIEGPVRIVTRTIREPGGREEITREEVRGPVTETTDSLSVSRPVAMAPSGGWVGGVGFDRWKPREIKDIAVYGGHRFGSRLEVIGRFKTSQDIGAVLLWKF